MIRTAPEYYHLGGTANAGAEGPGFFAGTRDPVPTCRQCGYVIPAFESCAVDIWTTASLNRADMETAHFASVRILHTDVLAALFPAGVPDTLSIGSVYDVRGKLIDSLKTCRPRLYVELRGSKNASYRYCRGCGRLCYFAQGYPYVCGSIINVPIVGSSLGLMVSSVIGQALVAQKWRKLEVRPVNREVHALDSFPDELPWRVELLDDVPQFTPESGIQKH